MEKRAEFNTALKNAMKEKNQIAVSTIRLIIAALKDRDISVREKNKGEGLDDAEILGMLQSMIKQRLESAKTYNEAGRDDLAEREEAEIEIIRSFMPKQLDEDEMTRVIEGLIAETGASDIKDMGKIMGVLKTKYAGQVDMARAGAIVRKKLA
ncbi:MAG: GatB/YqeY domain-containing protein [Alphaproteobacteria bacterium]|nr:GatB/YqeY domain-containing protein [Alphaproteobacteria bacterium]